MTSVDRCVQIESQGEARSTSVPERYRRHISQAGGPYFTLPSSLLRLVVEEVGKERFETELLEMDRDLSDVCGNHSSRIGFWGGQPIEYTLLRQNRDLEWHGFDEAMAEWGYSSYEARELLADLEQRSDWSRDVRRGYCGWLLTNPDFVAEQLRLFQKWKDYIANCGIPSIGFKVYDAQALPGTDQADDGTEPFIRDVEAFFLRWRLEGMPSPFAPLPMSPHLPVTDIRHLHTHVGQAGTAFFFPDICSVPSNNEIRAMIEQAVRDRQSPSHLAEWFDVVHSDNNTKNQIPRFARIFEVQHYVRAIYARHTSALHRKKSALIQALAEFLDVSDKSIEGDLTFIQAHLGAEWHLSNV